MWIVPFVVGGVFGKAVGKTWTSSLLYAGAVGWTSAQVSGLLRFLPFVRGVGNLGAAGRLAFAGQALWGMSVGGLITGVALGIAGGIGVSRLLFGKEGQEVAIDLYTGKVSPGLWADTLAKSPGRVAAITQGNRAVANNAASLPTGTNIASLAWEESRSQFMAPDPTHRYAEWWGTN